VPRAVLDTNILISALITPRGTPAKVLQSWRAGHFDVHLQSFEGIKIVRPSMFLQFLTSST
jgi:predicted nucleic acid-binding protein